MSGRRAKRISSAEGGSASSNANISRLSESRAVEPVATGGNMTPFAPPETSLVSLRELARELGRASARAQARRRGSVAVWDPWTLVALGITIAILVTWALSQ